VTACEICGNEPCSNSSFCATARKYDAARAREDVARGDEQIPQDLFRKIEKFVTRFVCYPSEHARTAHVLWIAHTHLMGAWESTPRLAALSPEPASGKTRLLEITELLVPNPVEAINVTPAYLFRKVGGEEGSPTILFDEIDTVFGPKAKENEEIRGLLNAGHRRGAVAGRCVVHGKQVMTEEIPAYCAVALAGLGWLPHTLLSRSIIIRMRRRHADEPVEPYRRRVHSGQGHQLRGWLALWAIGVAGKLSEAYPQMPEGVEDRDADMWEPLIAIADALGGEWPKRARSAAVALVTLAKEVEPSLGVKLLIDCKTAFGDADAIFTNVLLNTLHGMPESPWGDLRGKPLDDRGLAKRLRDFQIKSKLVRIGGRVLRGYGRADFDDAWKRYLPLLPSSGKSVTSVTGVTTGVTGDGDHGGGVTDVTNASITGVTGDGDGDGDNAGGVADVTDVTLSGEGGGDASVCRRCGLPGNATHGQLIRAGKDGAAGNFHLCCWTDERTKGPQSAGARKE